VAQEPVGTRAEVLLFAFREVFLGVRGGRSPARGAEIARVRHELGRAVPIPTRALRFFLEPAGDRQAESARDHREQVPEMHELERRALDEVTLLFPAGPRLRLKLCVHDHLDETRVQRLQEFVEARDLFGAERLVGIAVEPEILGAVVEREARDAAAQKFAHLALGDARDAFGLGEEYAEEREEFILAALREVASVRTAAREVVDESERLSVSERAGIPRETRIVLVEVAEIGRRVDAARGEGGQDRILRRRRHAAHEHARADRIAGRGRRNVAEEVHVPALEHLHHRQELGLGEDRRAAVGAASRRIETEDAHEAGVVGVAEAERPLDEFGDVLHVHVGEVERVHVALVRELHELGEVIVLEIVAVEVERHRSHRAADARVDLDQLVGDQLRPERGFLHDEAHRAAVRVDIGRVEIGRQVQQVVGEALAHVERAELELEHRAADLLLERNGNPAVERI